MTFSALLDRIREHARTRIRNGEVTERGLARRINVSQPHMHLVLKGDKRMTPAIADSLLREFGLTLYDLISP